MFVNSALNCHITSEIFAMESSVAIACAHPPRVPAASLLLIFSKAYLNLLKPVQPMKLTLRGSIVGLCLFLLPTAHAQQTETVIGWSSWMNQFDFSADVYNTYNSGKVLNTSGGTGTRFFSDIGAPYGSRAIADNWASGSGSKAWVFPLTTTRYNSLKFSCALSSTNGPGSFTGPRDWKLQYSLNGSTWVDVPGGSMTAGNGNNVYNYYNNITLPAACNDVASLYLRLVMTSNTSVTGGTVGNGQSHLDDLNVTGMSVPEAPTDITLSNSTFLVAKGGTILSNTTVGTLTSTDFNLGNTHTYSLVNGTGDDNNSYFSITGNTLKLSSTLGAGVYPIRIRSTDNGGLSFDKNFIIRISEPDAILDGTVSRLSSMGPTGSTAFNVLTGPAIAYNSTNNEYMTVWTGDDNTAPLVDNENEVFAQRINASNNAAVGSRIRVSFMGPDGATNFRANTPSIAYNATSNEYFVVWSGDHNSGSLVTTEFEIWGQRINAATGALIGSMIRISTMGTDGMNAFDATVPDVSWNSTNNQYMVVWQADDNTGGLVDNEFEIFGQVVTATGTLSGGRIRISTMGAVGNASFQATNPAIAYNATDNEYFVTWQSDDNTGALVDNEFEIYAQRLGSTGTLNGSRIRVSTMGADGVTSLTGITPDVAWNAYSNEYMVTWQGDDTTPPLVDGENEIFAQRISAAGILAGTRIRISDMGPDGSNLFNATAPKIMYHAALKEYWIVWQGDDNITSIDNDIEIFMQRVTVAGLETGNNDIRVSYMGPANMTTLSGLAPAIAYNSVDKKAYATWRGDDNTAPFVDNEIDVFGQALGAYLSTLPLTWVSFTANHLGGYKVLTSWETNNEINTASFNVQHSTDGINWTTIGTVNAAGNGTRYAQYSFEHKTAADGRNFYRIQQIDVDGMSSFSRTQLVIIHRSADLVIFPNPVVGKLNLQLPASTRALVRVYSNKGELLKEQTVTGNAAAVDVTNLTPGVYHVKVEQGGMIFNRTFIRK